MDLVKNWSDYYSKYLAILIEWTVMNIPFIIKVSIIQKVNQIYFILFFLYNFIMYMYNNIRILEVYFRL